MKASQSYTSTIYSTTRLYRAPTHPLPPTMHSSNPTYLFDLIRHKNLLDTVLRDLLRRVSIMHAMMDGAPRDYACSNDTIVDETMYKSRAVYEQFPDVSYLYTSVSEYIVADMGPGSVNRKYDTRSTWFRRFLFSMFRPSKRTKQIGHHTLRYDMSDPFSKFILAIVMNISEQDVATYRRLYARVPKKYKARDPDIFGYYDDCCGKVDITTKDCYTVNGYTRKKIQTATFLTYMNYLQLVYGMRTRYPELYKCVDCLTQIRSFI